RGGIPEREARARDIGFDGEMGFTEAGSEAGAEDLHFAALARQAEFDGVPVEPRNHVAEAGGDGRYAQAPHRLHQPGDGLMGEQRHMAENIVEAVRLLQIVEAVGRSDEVADRETELGQHGEKGIVRHQPRNRDAMPAGQPRQPLVEPVEIRNPRFVQPKLWNALQERGDNPRAEIRHLPREQAVPHAMLFRSEMVPVLRYEIALPARGLTAAYLGEIGLEHSKLLSGEGNKKPRRSEAWRGGGPVPRA